ncbi:MAG: ECF transporter S component [Oscillospiraceae bacterium]|nr:ECF transporter S component [Oscillospiraceae bacterium]
MNNELNKNKRTTNMVFRLTSLAVLAALSVSVIYLIHLPLIPTAAFLEYDPADIFILLAGLFFGWMAGFGTLIVAAAVQALTVSAGSGWYGFIMHTIATSALLVVTCLMHEKILNKPQMLPICLFFGCVAMTAIMIPANLLITPIFMGAPREAVKDMLVPVIIPFNAIKSVLNSTVACLLWLALTPILRKTPMKDFLR